MFTLAQTRERLERVFVMPSCASGSHVDRRPSRPAKAWPATVTFGTRDGMSGLNNQSYQRIQTLVGVTSS